MDIGIRKLLPAILVASLGYFVDLYDLLLFSVVRTKSLMDLGVPEADTAMVGLNLLNWMLASMIIGGVFWGILGDRKGRIWVLFGSIIIYSIANFLNAYITTVEQYRLLRIVAGFGLAGELGAGITLVSEMMKPEKRGFGTMFIATVGMFGAALAAVIGLVFNWRFAYMLGGILGFSLLFFRFWLKETDIFKGALNSKVSKGNIIHLFSDRKLRTKYFKSILPGIPVYFVMGILITLAPEFGKSYGMTTIPTAGMAVLISYLSASVGDVIYTNFSQRIRSRKKTFVFALLFLLVIILFYLYFNPASLIQFYILCALLGLACGYWIVLMTHIAEQFGTNYRATVTTTAPNFLRGFIIPISIIFMYLKPYLGFVNAAAIIAIVVVAIPFVFLYFVEDKFGISMDWVED